MPFAGKTGFDNIKSEADLLSFFKANFPDALDLMPGLNEEYFSNPTSSLITIKCDPWNYKDHVLLVGDAAHAIVPFYGQGMNSGFEDCNELNKLLDDRNDDWSEELLSDFSNQRTPNTNAIAEMAVDNYVEMRDATANPMFLLRKKIEHKMASKYPEKWVPQYSLVTFSNAAYSKAQQIGKRQSAIMDQIMLNSKIEQIWDSKEIEREILELVSSA
ncbi:MAG: FAD-dependent oxidoreductase, partial [Luteibaculum sp.]